MSVVKRFLKYVSFPTMSDENSPSCPSTDGQNILGEYIKNELLSLGIKNVVRDKNGYVYAFIPGSGALSEKDSIGFVAHLDTSDGASGENINAKTIVFDGSPILLDDGKTVISPETFPEMSILAGKELIVTDGSTLLGADDKAGIAEIVTAAEELLSEENRRPVAICFTPDEEIGRGADLFDVSLFKAKEGYTVDGGVLGEIEYENFNAASLHLTVNGVNIHPGSAKNKMKNSVLMANEFISMLPTAETPAHTEGYEGFYHISAISGDETICRIEGIIRDHDKVSFEKRKKTVLDICDYLNGKWGENSFVPEIKDSYYNMKEKILPCMYLIENARNAFSENGIEPIIVPIRGGTDGARLSFMGIPCPNLSTGGYNFHSCREFIPTESLTAMVKVIKHLAQH